MKHLSIIITILAVGVALFIGFVVVAPPEVCILHDDGQYYSEHEAEQDVREDIECNPDFATLRNIENLTSFSGYLEGMDRPDPDIAYDYILYLDEPVYDEYHASGFPWQTTLVLLTDESTGAALEPLAGSSVEVDGTMEWGLAESRVLRVTNVRK